MKQFGRQEEIEKVCNGVSGESQDPEKLLGTNGTKYFFSSGNLANKKLENRKQTLSGNTNH